MSGFATKKILKLQKPILEAKICDDLLFVIDIDNVLYVFDSSYTLKSKTRLVKDRCNLHSFCNRYSVSFNNVAIANGKTLVLANYAQGKITPKFKSELHEQDVVFTAYCETGEYLLSAGGDGKVFLFDTKMKSVRYIFKNKPDYCSCAVFSQMRNFVFVAYYNGDNTLLNLKDDNARHFKCDHPIEVAQFFDDEQKLFLCDRNGNSIIYDCVNFEVVSQSALYNQWISCAILSPNKKYIIAGTRKNKLYIIDPYKNQLIKTIEHDEEGVTSMSLSGSVLQLSFSNASLLLIDLEYQKVEFLIHLELKEYDKAKQILDQNNFLFFDDVIEKFYAGFSEVIVKARDMIEKGNSDEALQLVNPFMDFRKCREDIDLLFMQQEYIASFVKSVKEKNINNAYEVARTYPIIENLNLYQSLEKQWERDFAKARKSIEEDNLRGKEKAKEILSPYEKVIQKSNLIKQLLFNAKQFAHAESLIKKHDFAGYFKLVNSYSFLKNTRLYTRVENLASSISKKAMDECSNDQYNSAKKNFTNLLQFPYYNKQAKIQLEKIDVLLKLQKSIEENNITEVYSLIASFQFLSFVDMFKQFNKAFEKAVKVATAHARFGKISLAIEELRPYIDIKSLEKKVDNCMRVAYLQEIKASEFKDVMITVALAHYNALFGLDDELKHTLNKKGYLKEYEHFEKSPHTVELVRYPETILKDLKND